MLTPHKSGKGPEQIKVLIVDDSTSARTMLRKIVEGDPGLSVMGAAGDAFAAVRLMKAELPDVILLDLELPGMDGITFLKRIMEQRPMPVVVCSSHTEFGSEKSFEALEAGAVEVILKPSPQNEASRQEATVRICDAIHAAVQSRLGRRPQRPAPVRIAPPGPKLTANEILPPPVIGRAVPRTEPIVCIGASTGGTEALRVVLEMLPADAPAIAIVQHMPPGFTAAFAKRLNSLCAVNITEAVDGAPLTQGQVVIAQGDQHLMLRRVGASYRAHVVGGAQVSRHRPSVDVLFRSAAVQAGSNALGIILTGMGDDGARCMGEMKAMGAPTIAQDEASCVVYGMPREAVEMGSAVQTLSLERMAAAIMGFARRQRLGATG
ncbi:chemotaxis response regulator protein-glutamate methylesterase [Gemmobacter straminiformis]|uniref:Protein-glutamate methylesterase/protein-glutamine glutaminase n=1 Tax=Paragemmobacter straminiformis TaxID=2045119 RepID=A0A842I0N1_9RHOB|nr:chemotaxis response regulator protein-glutamate methylesterase [Gemmobacter straminiformis]MBC2834132.1 chemotaxis response regulator protein-glutamate methylesterase [Gemmobacter straminiformis]